MKFPSPKYRAFFDHVSNYRPFSNFLSSKDINLKYQILKREQHRFRNTPFFIFVFFFNIKAANLTETDAAVHLWKSPSLVSYFHSARHDVIPFGHHRSVIFIGQTMRYCSRCSRECFLGLILLGTSKCQATNGAKITWRIVNFVRTARPLYTSFYILTPLPTMNQPLFETNKLYLISPATMPRYYSGRSRFSVSRIFRPTYSFGERCESVI